MASIAHVIVDVPAKQTNRPFDYSIPAHLQAVVRVGSRVAVPFGPRFLQGIVVGLASDSDTPEQKLKSLADVMDLRPPLTSDLIALGQWMSTHYVCPQIIAYQAMLPAALKVTYERGFFLLDEQAHNHATNAADQALLDWIRANPGKTVAQLTERFPEQVGVLQTWLEQNIIEQRQAIKAKGGVKQQLFVRRVATIEQVEQALAKVAANAVQQVRILRALLSLDEPRVAADFIAETESSLPALRALEAKGLVEVALGQVERDPYALRTFEKSEPMPLTEEQSAVCGTITASMDAAVAQTYLLRGVTGSGKTEVYLQAIAHCLAQGKQAIVLVPEIALTPQMVDRFKSRFGDEVAVLHSGLSTGERYDEWRKIGEGRVKVAIGARSAVFAPFAKLGLIIMDEEHETSYKQEDSPKYHARDVAIARARLTGAVVVLGSATPSLESVVAAERGDFGYLHMENRVFQQAMPTVHIVDMREELAAGNRAMFSRALQEAIVDRQARGEQTILLLNRRGHSTFVMCRTCGHTVQCPHCEIAMTYHKQSHALRCHYCGYAEREPDQCPSCAGPHIRYFGTGTQRVEEQLLSQFPGLRVIRMDVDTTSTKGAHEALLTRFRNKEADVLLGTQMVAKGLDFPDVTLVGVIAADTVLHLPDFRASERTFQLLTQVAGRAGRHQLPGEVVIQTYHPDHYSIVHAQEHDFRAFVEKEKGLREKLDYPPYCELALVTFSHKDSRVAIQGAQAFVEHVRGEIGGAEVTFLGPVPAPLAKIKDRYRMQILIKYPMVSSAVLSEALGLAGMEIERAKAFGDLQVQIDVQPQMLM